MLPKWEEVRRTILEIIRKIHGQGGNEKPVGQPMF